MRFPFGTTLAVRFLVALGLAGLAVPAHAVPVQITFAEPTPVNALRRNLLPSEARSLASLFQPTDADRQVARTRFARLRGQFLRWHANLEAQFPATSVRARDAVVRWLARDRRSQPRFVEPDAISSWRTEPPARFATTLAIRPPRFAERIAADARVTGTSRSDRCDAVTVWFLERILSEDYATARIAFEDLSALLPKTEMDSTNPRPIDITPVVRGALEDLEHDPSDVKALLRLVACLTHRHSLSLPDLRVPAIYALFRLSERTTEDQPLGWIALAIAEICGMDWLNSDDGFELVEPCAMTALTLAGDSDHLTLRETCGALLGARRLAGKQSALGAEIVRESLLDGPSTAHGIRASLMAAIVRRHQHAPHEAIELLTRAWDVATLDVVIPGTRSPYWLDDYKVAREVSLAYEDLRDWDEAYRWGRIAYIDHRPGSGCGLGAIAIRDQCERELKRLESKLATSKRSSGASR